MNGGREGWTKEGEREGGRQRMSKRVREGGSE